MLSSASEDENEAPELWVNNSAYTLNCHDRELVSSRRLRDIKACTTSEAV